MGPRASLHLTKMMIAVPILWLFQSIDGFSQPVLTIRRRHRHYSLEGGGLLLSQSADNDNLNAFDNASASVDAKDAPKVDKRIVFIRHGCTYMNEYLSGKGTRWGDPHFTDVFDDESLYRDSPLSPRGVRQAQDLSSRLGRVVAAGAGGVDGDGHDNIIDDIQLIACSPLSRALQTMDIAMSPHIWPGRVPIVALPQASERVYLISDLGEKASVLKTQYPVVDFDSEIPNERSDEWWYTSSNDDVDDVNYVEWRPNNQGQKYACPGEPELAFNERMGSLYDWLEAREETCIALISHWGVIEWLTGSDFDNCEMGVIGFSSMSRAGFMLSEEEADNLFKQGERSVVCDQ
ncbi:hypothetical protein ACHAWF_003126 [Thalassiosira exigua]